MPDPNEPDRSPPVAAEMSREELAEAKRYSRQALACELADRLVDLVYLALAAFILARPLDRWLQSWPWLDACWSLRLVILFGIVVGLHAAVSFPVSYFSGYVLEHRYRLSRQTWRAWLWRYIKRNLLGIALGAVLVLGLYWVIWIVGPYWWLVASAAFFVVSVLIGQLAPVLILPLFYRVEALERPDLAERLARLAEGTGLSIQGIYRLMLSDETVKANAMLAGLGRTRRVLLGDTLLDQFTPEEIEVIFAHEIGHHVFRHMRKLLITGILYSLAGFWICDRLVAAWVTWSSGAFHYASLPVYTLPLLMLILVVFTTVVEPLQNAISRRFERQSDRYALTRTGLVAAYVAAFRKLARLNKDDPEPHWLEVLLLHSHPPIAERLAMAQRYVAGDCPDSSGRRPQKWDCPLPPPR